MSGTRKEGVLALRPQDRSQTPEEAVDVCRMSPDQRSEVPDGRLEVVGHPARAVSETLEIP